MSACRSCELVELSRTKAFAPVCLTSKLHSSLVEVPTAPKMVRNHKWTVPSPFNNLLNLDYLLTRFITNRSCIFIEFEKQKLRDCFAVTISSISPDQRWDLPYLCQFVLSVPDCHVYQLFSDAKRDSNMAEVVCLLCNSSVKRSAQESHVHTHHRSTFNLQLPLVSLPVNLHFPTVLISLKLIQTSWLIEPLMFSLISATWLQCGYKSNYYPYLTVPTCLQTDVPVLYLRM